MISESRSSRGRRRGGEAGGKSSPGSGGGAMIGRTRSGCSDCQSETSEDLTSTICCPSAVRARRVCDSHRPGAAAGIDTIEGACARPEPSFQMRSPRESCAMQAARGVERHGRAASLALPFGSPARRLGRVRGGRRGGSRAAVPATAIEPDITVTGADGQAALGAEGQRGWSGLESSKLDSRGGVGDLPDRGRGHAPRLRPPASGRRE